MRHFPFIVISIVVFVMHATVAEYVRIFNQAFALLNGIRNQVKCSQHRFILTKLYVCLAGQPSPWLTGLNHY